MIVTIEKFRKKYRVIVPDGSPENTWQYGIVIGPPDLSGLDLPPALLVRLHNELFARGLITKNDAQKRIQDITGALMAALKTDAQTIQAIYAQGEGS